MHFPAALYLPRDAFDVKSQQVLGRRVAGRLLARSFAQQLESDEMLTLCSPGDGAVEAISELLSDCVPAGSTVRVSGHPSPALLQEIGALYIPDPVLGHWSSLRQGLSPAAFSLTGVIHTVCSEGALRGIGDLPLSPVYSWDAVVCTSTAGRAVVQHALEHRLEAMAARLLGSGLSERSLAVDLPQLPVIPLVASTEQPYRPELSRSDRRLLARQQLAIPPEAFVVTFVGRLSFHSKCHPASLYRALECLAELPSSPPVFLVECGHIFNPWIASAYEELRGHFPHLQFRLVGGLEPATESAKWEALAAADVFSSPSDNLQETFGLSLLEAMAAELPLVVSDWNGYRDLVQHGSNGFLVPTADVLADLEGSDEIEAQFGLGTLDYDAMIGMRSLGVVVDHQAYVEAFQALLVSPGKRAEMAASSRAILLERFSANAVVRAYRELWDDLACRRQQASAQPALAPSLPALKPGYSRLFSHYSTDGFKELHALPIAAPQPTHHLSSQMNEWLLKSLAAGYLPRIIALLEGNEPVGCPELQALGLSEAQAVHVLAALHKLGLAPHLA